MGKNDSMDLALSCSATFFSWRDRVWIAYHCPAPTESCLVLALLAKRSEPLTTDFATTPLTIIDLLAMTAFIASPCHLGSRDRPSVLNPQPTNTARPAVHARHTNVKRQ